MDRLTVGANLEHYLLVAFPVRGRELSSMRSSNLIILASLLGAVTLHMFLPIYYSPLTAPCFYLPAEGRVIESLQNDTRSRYHLYPAAYSFRPGPFNESSLKIDHKFLFWLGVYRRAYFWSSSILSVVLPLLALLFFSIAIYARLFCGESGRFRGSNAEQKECVVRLALAATASHLLFETPQVPPPSFPLSLPHPVLCP